MSTFKGLAVPLHGESQIYQLTAANDIITLTAITAATGDFLVCETAGGGEVFVVEADGRLVLAGGAGGLGFASLPTTAPTTGLTKGDLFVVNGSTNMQLALCISTAANTLRYFTPDTVTFGRDSITG